jgi:phage antirepressor YoqD-like protein
MVVTIKKWDKFNPKRAQKTYTWLRLNNDFFQDRKFFKQPPHVRLGWVILLCMASKENKGVLDFGEFGLEVFCDEAKLTKEQASEMFDFLSEKGLVTVTLKKDNDSTKNHYTETTPTRRDETERDETDETLKAESGKPDPAPKPKKSNRTGVLKISNVTELLLEIGEDRFNEWVEMYPDRQWVERELIKAYQYYRDAGKGNKTLKGWKQAMAGWLGRGWDRRGNSGHGAPQTKSERVSLGNATLWDELEKESGNGQDTV